MLEENKKAWHLKIKYSLWVEKISTKRSIGTSPSQLVYGTNVFFPVSLGIQVLKYLQIQDLETDSIQNRINHLIELQELWEEAYHKSQIFQGKMKSVFDRKVKKEHYHVGNLVLKSDFRFEDKGKHGKFDHLWKRPYQIVVYSGNNAYILKEVNGDFLPGGPVNGRFLKTYF